VKTSIVQTTLGLLIIVSAFLFSVLVEPGYWVARGIDSEFGVMVMGNPGRNTAMIDWMLSYAGLGLAVLAAGIISFFLRGRTSKSWLALVQVVFGGLVVISLVAYMIWVEPDWAPYTTLSHSTGNLVVMRHDSVWVVRQIVWKVASILVGLGVAGLGLIQMRHYRKG
jgi:hypothetical protein